MNVNWWLVGLAFVLGLGITLVFMIRRVEREVPVYGAPGRGSGGASGVGTSGAAAKLVGSGGGAGDSETTKLSAVGEEPHGPGSATPGPGGSGPDGWTVKGNEDSMLYHSPESPSYKRTVAEVWFRDVETAEAAGFNRWDSGKSQRGQT